MKAYWTRFFAAWLALLICLPHTGVPQDRWHYVEGGGANRNIYSITAVDSLHLWACGEFGEWGFGDVMKTSDGGKSWQFCNAHLLWFQVAIWFADTSNGWMLGFDGIRYTSDGGTTWTLQKSLASNEVQSTSRIVGTDKKHIWIATGLTLYKTTDMGGTWIDQNPGDYPGGLAFADSLYGWMAGDYKIKRTTDGGASWTEQLNHFVESPTFLGIVCVGKWHVWVVGAQGLIMHSTDAGGSWQTQESGLKEYLWDIHFVDTLRGWVAAGSRVLVTTNGGTTWQEQAQITSGWSQQFTFSDSRRGWLASEKCVYALANGSEWTLISQGTVTNLKDVCYGDLSFVAACGDNGMRISTDGGIQWGTGLPSDRMESVCFANRNLGWAAQTESAGGFRTTDGGNNWISFPVQPGTNRQMLFLDSTNGWSVGNKILFSSDGGNTWNEQYTVMDHTGEFLRKCAFSDRLHGWAVSASILYGKHGRIVGTTDGGITWKLQWDADDWASVCCLDSLHAWAVGYEGRILATTDGGGHWTTQVSGTTEGLIDVCAIDSNGVWAVGSGGIILKTTDGGQNWISVSSGTTLDLLGVAFRDANHGLAVGDLGIILRYGDNVPTMTVKDYSNHTQARRFVLEQNYPNPFNPSTVVSYQLPVASNVKLAIYDLLGREVAILVNERKMPGTYEVKFDGSNLASGVYFYRLQTGDFMQTRKLLLIR
jgi:photosystem II stability/assembly factor-like uncharacterized protein